MKDKINDEELEILVSAYQDGSTDAAERLVESYEGYFQKFLNVLKNRFSIRDNTERGFVRHFVKSAEARQNFHLFQRSDYIRRVAYATVTEIRDRYERYEMDELKNEMVIIFLKMAGRHNFEAPFRIYISKFFPKNLYKFLKNLHKKQADAGEELYLDEDDIRTAHYDDYNFDERPRYYIHATTPTDFDENWVNGYGCGLLFEDLTIYERRLLKLYYEWRTLPLLGLADDIHAERKEWLKRTEDDIAELFGCSRKTINVKRNEIKRKLEKLAEELHLTGDNHSLSHI